MSAQPDSRCHPPTKHDLADGISRAPARHAEQNLQTTHRQPSFSSPRPATETEQPRLPACLLSSGCSQLRVPRPEPRSSVAATSTNTGEAEAAVALRPLRYCATGNSQSQSDLRLGSKSFSCCGNKPDNHS